MSKEIKARARYLISRFISPNQKSYSDAIQCAIICCNEIIENYYEAHYETEGHYQFKDVRDFWGNVKEELSIMKMYEAKETKK